MPITIRTSIGKNGSDQLTGEITLTEGSSKLAITQSAQDLSLDVNASSSNTPSVIVQRDGSGDFATNAITLGADPVNAMQASTKQYVDTAIDRRTYKDACKLATVAPLPANTYNNGSSGVGATLTGISVGALSVDGVTPSVGNRILVKNEVSGENNGIYVVTAVGSGIAVYVLTRSSDFNESADITEGDSSVIAEGSTLASTTWELSTPGTIVVGTTSLSFVQIAGPGSIIAGTGISVAGNTVSLQVPVVVANGGTNSTSALSNNRVMQSSGGAIVEAAAITASRALKSDSNGIPVASTASAASIDALSGTNTGDQTITLTGDVTGSGTGSFAATIATGAVTDAKSSLSVKPSSGVVATSNQTLSGFPTIDGVTVVDGTIILLTAQSTGAENGFWLSHAGAWTRPTWYPSGGTTQAIQTMSSFIRAGTIYKGTTWRCNTANPITIDTTSTAWAVVAFALNSSTVSGNLPVVYGGTGSISLTANNVLLGNGTSSLQEVAPGTSGNILTSNGTTWQSTAASSAAAANVQTFVASSTWTMPANAKSVSVAVWGAGGGGGGGRTSNSGSARGGGCGGGGGAFSRMIYNAASLGASQTITIGAAGTGGAGGGTSASNGTDGGAGGLSSFGTSGAFGYIQAYGGGGGAGGASGSKTGGAGGGAGSVGETGAASAVNGGLPYIGINNQGRGISGAGAGNTGAGNIGNPSEYGGANGAGGTGTAATGNAGGVSLYGGGAGGAGAGCASGNAEQVGGAGGQTGIYNDVGGGGGAGGAVHSAGTGGVIIGFGGGGGGSSNSTTVNGGAGGVGGIAGGGGGGGAGTSAGSASAGAGGNGGGGQIVVTTYF